MNHDRAAPGTTTLPVRPPTDGGGYLVRKDAPDIRLRIGRRQIPVRRVGVLEVEVDAIPEVAWLPGETLKVTLMASGIRLGPISGRVTHLEASMEGARRATLTLEPTLATGRALLGLLRTLALQGSLTVPGSRFLPIETVSDAVRIRRLMNAVADAASPVQLGRHGASAVVPGTAAGLALGSDRPLVWAVGSDPGRGPLDVRVEGYSSAFLFRAEDSSFDAGHLATPKPGEILRTRTRRHRRAEAPADVWVRFQHPVWPEVEVSRPVLDIALGGFGFSTDALQDVLWPGLELPGLEVAFPGQPPLAVAGTVRHVSGDGRGLGQSCGVEIEGPLDAWLALIEPWLYPHTTRAGSEDGLWDLYVHSGYFNISGKEESEFAEIRAAFAASTEAIRRSPEVAACVSWASSRGVEASMTMAKPYAGTWVAYQLARRQDDPPGPVTARHVLRDTLLHTLEHAWRDPDFRWFVTWLPTHARFPHRITGDFTKRWTWDPERAVIVPFQAFEGQAEIPIRGIVEGYEVDDPTADERLMFTDQLLAHRGRPFVEAHDLVPGRLDLGDAWRDWNRRGLARDRILRVARQDGVPVAMVVAELAEEGIHLFALFHTVRLHAMAPGGEAAFPALLEAARAWYASQGEKKFVLFLEDPWPGISETGLVDLGTADTTVLSADLFPDQLEHIWEITAPRAPAPRATADEETHR